MRRVTLGLAFLVLAAAAFSGTWAQDQVVLAAPAAGNGQVTGVVPEPLPSPGYAAVPVRYDQPCLPRHAWPTYSAYPNYGAVTYPTQYSASAWPYVGPFYPYPQVPLGWRHTTLKWDDGWWFLDFKAK